MINKEQVSWKKGKTKKDYPRLSNSGVKKGWKYPPGRVAWNKGLPAWNKGKTKEDYPQFSNSGVKKGSVSPNKGKTFSRKWRENLSLAHIGKYIGKKHPNWQGGISFEPYSSEFTEQLKELIRYRDGYKCQKCSCPEIEDGRKLSVHHIDYDKKNCLPTNLISLCKRCNAKVNSNRQKWTKYFQNKIKKIMDSSKIQLNFRFKNHKKLIAIGDRN